MQQDLISPLLLLSSVACVNVKGLHEGQCFSNDAMLIPSVLDDAQLYFWHVICSVLQDMV